MKSLRSLHGWAASGTHNGSGSGSGSSARLFYRGAGAVASGLASDPRRGLGSVRPVTPGLVSCGGRRGFARSAVRNRDRAGDHDSTLPERFRAVMRRMPHPVVIITTLDCPRFSSSSSSSSSSSTAPAFPAHWTESDILESYSDSEDSRSGKQPRPIPRAMTVSSFTSLSLRPRERVLFNIALPSRTYHAIFSSRRFNAHVLAADHHGARLADLFTKGYGLGPAGGGGGAEDHAPRTGLGALAGLDAYGVQVLGKEEWDREWDAYSAAHGDGGGGGEGAGARLMTKFTAPLLRGPGVTHVLQCDLYAPAYLDNRPEPSPDDNPRGDHHRPHHDNFAIMLGEVTDIVPGVVDADADADVTLAYVDGAYRRPGDPILKHAIAGPPKR